MVSTASIDMILKNHSIRFNAMLCNTFHTQHRNIVQHITVCVHTINLCDRYYTCLMPYFYNLDTYRSFENVIVSLCSWGFYAIIFFSSAIDRLIFVFMLCYTITIFLRHNRIYTETYIQTGIQAHTHTHHCCRL